jgi:Abi-like protein
MNPSFFQKIEDILHTERLDSYRRDGADEALTLSRYALNMALSESLYPALQFAEIALRNVVHKAMTDHCGTDAWYDDPQARLLGWQSRKVTEARRTLQSNRKQETPGRMVAELNFGFWTGFFNLDHAQTGVGHYLASRAFPHAPIDEQDFIKLGHRWKKIRDLRNRVFHHERIIHWRDLDAQHMVILEVISWMSPELSELALALDRFVSVRSAGLKPWQSKLVRHWPAGASVPSTVPSVIESVDSSFDASNGAHTPFGHRWGGDVFSLSHSHLETIQQGQTLALDVMGEYVVFLKTEEGGRK